MKKPFLPYANIKGSDSWKYVQSDQTDKRVHVHLIFKYKLSRYKLASVPAQADLSSLWLETVKSVFLMRLIRI